VTAGTGRVADDGFGGRGKGPFCISVGDSTVSDWALSVLWGMGSLSSLSFGRSDSVEPLFFSDGVEGRLYSSRASSA
jgi:hypothetical protein